MDSAKSKRTLEKSKLKDYKIQKMKDYIILKFKKKRRLNCQKIES